MMRNRVAWGGYLIEFVGIGVVQALKGLVVRARIVVFIARMFNSREEVT
jgi:hypothetical protein